jgi:hypothetical protein
LKWFFFGKFQFPKELRFDLIIQRKLFLSADLPTRIDLIGAALPVGAPLAVGLALHPPACCGGFGGRSAGGWTLLGISGMAQGKYQH